MTAADMIHQAAATLTAAGRAQRDQTPAPEDFRDISLAIEQVLDALFAINGNIGAQLARHGEREQPRTAGARTTTKATAAVMNHGRALDIGAPPGPPVRQGHDQRMRPARARRGLTWPG